MTLVKTLVFIGKTVNTVLIVAAENNLKLSEIQKLVDKKARIASFDQIQAIFPASVKGHCMFILLSDSAFSCSGCSSLFSLDPRSIAILSRPLLFRF